MPLFYVQFDYQTPTGGKEVYVVSHISVDESEFYFDLFQDYFDDLIPDEVNPHLLEVDMRTLKEFSFDKGNNILLNIMRDEHMEYIYAGSLTTYSADNSVDEEVPYDFSSPNMVNIKDPRVPDVIVETDSDTRRRQRNRLIGPFRMTEMSIFDTITYTKFDCKGYPIKTTYLLALDNEGMIWEVGYKYEKASIVMGHPIYVMHDYLIIHDRNEVGLWNCKYPTYNNSTIPTPNIYSSKAEFNEANSGWSNWRKVQVRLWTEEGTAPGLVSTEYMPFPKYKDHSKCADHLSENIIYNWILDMDVVKNNRVVIVELCVHLQTVPFGMLCPKDHHGKIGYRSHYRADSIMDINKARYPRKTIENAHTEWKDSVKRWRKNLKTRRRRYWVLAQDVGVDGVLVFQTVLNDEGIPTIEAY